MREAITAANANDNEPTVDLINFAIPGSGVHTITPNSDLNSNDLPPITEQVTIDGYSQTGASPNTQEQGNDAVLKIELDGTNAGTGLRI